MDHHAGNLIAPNTHLAIMLLEYADYIVVQYYGESSEYSNLFNYLKYCVETVLVDLVVQPEICMYLERRGRLACGHFCRHSLSKCRKKVHRHFECLHLDYCILLQFLELEHATLFVALG